MVQLDKNGESRMHSGNNSSAGGIADPTHLRHYALMLWRQRWIIGATVGLSVAAAAIAVSAKPSQYMAEAVVALNARKVQIIPTDEVVSRLPQESPVLRTELDIISSRSMAEGVLDRLPPGLLAEPPVARDGGLQALLRRLVPSPFGLGEAVTSGRDSTTRSPEELRRDLIDRLLGGLSVSNDGRSFTIFIAYTATDPVVAATVANAYAEAYLQQQVSVQMAGTREASEWLARRLDDLRRRLERSEAAVKAFRQQSGLIEANGMTPQTQRLNALSAELAVARSARAAAEARLATARALSQTDGGLESLAEVLNSTVIQPLWLQRTDLRRAIAEIEAAGVTRSTQLPNLNSRLEALNGQIDDEIARVLSSLENEVDVATRREESIAGAQRDAEDDVGKADEATVQLAQLEREAGANRVVYESFLNRYKQTIEQEGLATPEARLISAAQPPGGPSGRRLPAVVLGFLAGGCVGVGLAILRDRLDTRIYAAAAIENGTGVPVLALLPRPPRHWRLPTQCQPVLRPRSGYSVALQMLSSTLRPSSRTANACVIALAAADRGDGKTVLAVSLARALALTGERVVVVDAHVQAPAVSRIFGVPEPKVALVSGGGGDGAIHTDTQTRASFVTCVGRSGEAERGGTEHLSEMLATLRQLFDFVLIDTPPLTVSAEATRIAGMADATLLVARWRSTSAGDLVAAVRQFTLCGIKPTGIVVDMVDKRYLSDCAVPSPAVLRPDGEETERRRPIVVQPPGGSGPASAARHGAPLQLGPRTPDARQFT